MPVRGKKHRSRKLLAVAVLLLLALLSAANFKLAKDPLWKLARHELTFEEYVDKVQTGYLSDNFAYKNDFLNLNGLFARLTGRRVLNNVVRLNNGMLSQVVSDIDTTPLADTIADSSNYLNKQNIPFLYIQMPYKESLDGQSFPVGISSYANKNTDELLSQLSAEGIETLDLRPLLAKTPEMLEQYFARTDHHWKADGAFVAFQEVLYCLHELFPDGNIDLTYARADQWERHSIDNWFLGSLGKRVGIFFGGTETFYWYTPRFETEMSCVIPSRGQLFRGDFTEANMRMQYIEKKDYFNSNAYTSFIGSDSDSPLVQHRNLNAPSPLKIIMIRDSFTRPLQMFLSTVFQEIDVIDPRYFSECTIAEYVERTKPDIVIFGINPGVFGEKSYQNFGLKEANPTSAEEATYELINRQDIAIEAKDNKNNYTAYPLEPNAIYRVSFSKVDILEGVTAGVGLRLYNKTSKKVLQNTLFDIAYCEAKKDFSWTFRTPDTEDELELLFYAGIYGSTQGKGVVYHNVTLKKSQIME